MEAREEEGPSGETGTPHPTVYLLAEETTVPASERWKQARPGSEHN